MSANNGVYILKTDNQYRVKHIQSIENLYWNSQGLYCDTMQPEQIVRLFGKCKHTYNAEKAIDIALNIQNNLSICEYGIVLLDAKKSWREIIKENKNGTCGMG